MSFFARVGYRKIVYCQFQIKLLITANHGFKHQECRIVATMQRNLLSDSTLHIREFYSRSFRTSDTLDNDTRRAQTGRQGIGYRYRSQRNDLLKLLNEKTEDSIDRKTTRVRFITWKVRLSIFSPSSSNCFLFLSVYFPRRYVTRIPLRLQRTRATDNQAGHTTLTP